MVAEPKDIGYRGKAKNKREFFRLNERLKIHVKTLKKYAHYTIDISAGGLQFFSNEFYRENTHAEITLYFKETDPPFEPVTVKAKILRAVQVENSHYYNVAAIFITLDPKDRSQIERYIFMRQREMIAERRIGFL